MRRLNLDIPLNPKQVAMYNALNSGHYTSVLFYGASRSGKTEITDDTDVEDILKAALKNMAFM